MTTQLLPVTSAKRIGRLARIAEAIAMAAIIGVLLYVVYVAVFPAELRAMMLLGIPSPITEPPVWAFGLASLLTAIPAGLFVVSMWQVRKLFRYLAQGSFADAGFTTTLRRLGWLAVCGGVVGFAVRTLVPLLMTVANPPGQKMLIIEFNSGQVASLIMGLLFLVFTHVFAEVTRMAEENRSFI
jgi:hypothetical protein